MKRRPWVLIIMIFSLALVYAAIVLVRYINTSNWLHNKIQAATAHIPGDFTLEKVKLESNVLRLGDIAYVSADSSIIVKINQVKLEISLPNMIAEGTDILSLVRSVTLTEPSIIFIPGKVKKNEKITGTGDGEVFTMSKYDFIKHVVLNNGDFSVKSDLNNDIFSIDNLNGWVNAENYKEASCNLEMVVFDDTTSTISINGKLNLYNFIGSIEVILNGLKCNNLKIPGTDDVRLTDGILSSTTNVLLSEDGWATTGFINLVDGALEVKKGPTISSIDLTGNLNEKSINLFGKCLFENDSVSIKSEIDISDKLTLHAEAQTEKGRIGQHLMKFASLKRSEVPWGLLKADFSFDWEAGKNWIATANATADTLNTAIGPFYNVNGKFSLQRDDQFLRFEEVTGYWYGLKSVSTGSWNPKREKRFDVVTDVSGKGNSKGLPGYLNEINYKTADASLDIYEIRGSGFEVVGTGSIEDERNNLVAEVAGSINKNYWQLSFSRLSDTNRYASITASSFDFHKVHVISSQPHLMANWWSPKFETNADIKQLGIGLSFDIDNSINNFVKGNATIRDIKSGIGLDIFGSVIKNEEKTIDGAYSYSFLKNETLIGNGTIDFTLGDSSLFINKISYQDYLTIAGEYDLKNKDVKDLTIVANEFDLNDFLPDLLKIEEDRIEGVVDGHAEINGNIRLPNINANFELFDGRLDEYSNYWGQLNIKTVEPGKFNIAGTHFGHNETTILELQGEYQFNEDNLDLEVKSPGNNESIRAYDIFGHEKTLSGNLKFAGEIDGRFLKPEWNIQIEMDSASVLGINFDSVAIDLKGGADEFDNQTMSLKKLDMEKINQYHLEASGYTPIKKGKGAFNIELDGEILHILPQITSFFRNPTGEGRVEWNLDILDGSLVASHGRLFIANGGLEFSEVFPNVKNTWIDIQIDSTGYALINRFDGTIGENGHSKIRNIPTEVFEDGSIKLHKFPANMNSTRLEELRKISADSTFNNLYPLQINAVGIVLGVLELQTTSEDGVPINIPDVMVTPDFARLELSGKGSYPWVQISRDFETKIFDTPDDTLKIENVDGKNQINKSVVLNNNLKIKGSASIRDAQFTYPPLNYNPETARAPEDLDLIPYLLFNANWDVEAFIGRDVDFVREIMGFENAPIFETVGGFIDRIDVELTITPSDPDLPLRGAGTVADTSFRLIGELSSERGWINFIDLEFELEKGKAIFDDSSPLPIVSGRAKTIVSSRTNSSGDVVSSEFRVPKQIYLTLYVIDPITGEKYPEGRWGEITFMLEDDLGGSQEEILQAMGYIGDGARALSQVGGEVLIRTVSRRWLRPVERSVEKWLGVDQFRVNPTIATYMYAQEENGADFAGENTNYLNYFQASYFTVGKYLTPTLFLSYTGQYGRDYDVTNSGYVLPRSIGYLQKWNMEYRMESFSPNLLLEAEWEYDNLNEKPSEQNNPHNRSVKLKYTFIF